MFAFFRNRRRRKLLAEPFPAHWEAILRRNVGHVHYLSDIELSRLKDALRVFVAEKTWEGCGGLFVTEEMKVTVAAQASLLLLGSNEHDYYARVPSVVMYPGQFRTPVEEDGWEDDELSDRIADGQAVYRGPVILAWDQVLNDGRHPEAGFNVVIHEFAHQLDFLDNVIDGTPPLNSRELELRWQKVMTEAFQKHQKQIDRGDEGIFFSEQAAENETEFFADATEAFFCTPKDLNDENPNIYELLADFYQLHTIDWFTRRADQGNSRVS